MLQTRFLLTARLSQPSLHPNGQSHIDIWEVPSLYNNVVIPLHCFQDAGLVDADLTTSVTPDHVRLAADFHKLETSGQYHNGKRHPNGQRLITIRDAQDVYSGRYQLRHFVSIGMRGATLLTKVTPEHVERVRFANSGDGVLGDIKTGMGCVPRGGAYKDWD
ncbi:hypothetical protein HDZ31DRAFT_71882 [Schizophyllum fasciatum]